MLNHNFKDGNRTKVIACIILLSISIILGTQSIFIFGPNKPLIDAISADSRLVIASPLNNNLQFRIPTIDKDDEDDDKKSVKDKKNKDHGKNHSNNSGSTSNNVHPDNNNDNDGKDIKIKEDEDESEQEEDKYDDDITDEVGLRANETSDVDIAKLRRSRVKLCGDSTIPKLNAIEQSKTFKAYVVPKSSITKGLPPIDDVNNNIHNDTIYLNQIIDDIPIESSKRSILGVFDARKSYNYIPTHCTVLNRLSPEQPEYFCDTLHVSGPAKAPYKKRDGPESPLYCGSFPMESGNCFTPSKGKFVYHDRPSNASLNNDPIDIENWRVHCKWCQKSRDDYSFATYESDKVYLTKSCDLVTMHPKVLIKHLADKSVILIMGSSHERQILRAIMAELRNEAVVVESHGDLNIQDNLNPFFRYEFSEHGDQLSEGFYSNYLNQSDVNTCITSPETGKCVVIVFVWLETFIRQTTFIQETFDKLKPHTVIVSTVVAHDPVSILPRPWKEAWEGIQHRPKNFFYVTFPKDTKDAKRDDQIRNWFQESKLFQPNQDNAVINSAVIHRECFHQNVFVRFPEAQCTKGEINYMIALSLRKVYKQNRGRRPLSIPDSLIHYEVTSHTTCQAYNQYPAPKKILKESDYKLDSVSAYYKCDSQIDRAIARTLLTLIVYGED